MNFKKKQKMGAHTQQQQKQQKTTAKIKATSAPSARTITPIR